MNNNSLKSDLACLSCIKFNKNYIQYLDDSILLKLHVYRGTQKNNDALWSKKRKFLKPTGGIKTIKKLNSFCKITEKLF